MATARQIVALLSSLNAGDEEQFYAIALQVAAAEAKRGRRSVADELRLLVEQGRERKSAREHGRALDNVVVPITKLMESETLIQQATNNTKEQSKTRQRIVCKS